MRNTADLTGTKITSSSRIVVLSGTEWTPILTAKASSIGTHVAMQLSPVNEWGQLFLSSPSEGDNQMADTSSMRLLGMCLIHIAGICVCFT
jgi:IgGFc binding protein